jgi:hypothetical protein
VTTLSSRCRAEISEGPRGRKWPSSRRWVWRSAEAVCAGGGGDEVVIADIAGISGPGAGSTHIPSGIPRHTDNRLCARCRRAERLRPGQLLMNRLRQSVWSGRRRPRRLGLADRRQPQRARSMACRPSCRMIERGQGGHIVNTASCRPSSRYRPRHSARQVRGILQSLPSNRQVRLASACVGRRETNFTNPSCRAPELCADRLLGVARRCSRVSRP